MASDIFSLLGISNIGDWIERWMNLYEAAIKTFVSKFGEEESRKFFEKYSINTDVNKQRDISDTQYNNIQNGSLKMEKDQHRLMKKLLIASMQNRESIGEIC